MCLRFGRGSRHLDIATQVGSLGADVPAVGAVELPPIRWTRSPAARRVWVGIWYSAFEPKGADPSLTVELQDAGLALDDAATWTIDNGYLEVGEDHTRDLAEAVAAAGGDAALGAEAFFAATAPPDLFVHTGWSTLPIGDEPRLLELPEAGHGEVQLAVSGSAVRIYSVVWAEAFLGEL